MKAKPCPWCGTDQKDPKKTFTNHGEIIYCDTCGKSGPAGESLDEALTAWNTRPIEDELAEALAGLIWVVELLAGYSSAKLNDRQREKHDQAVAILKRVEV